MEGMYLIWSNEHRLWWGQNHSGYTPDVKRAGLYTQDQMLSICRGANAHIPHTEPPNEIPVPADITLHILTDKDQNQTK